jgi:hypothetical protein
MIFEKYNFVNIRLSFGICIKFCVPSTLVLFDSKLRILIFKYTIDNP